jgi:hypothetical protein
MAFKGKGGAVTETLKEMIVRPRGATREVSPTEAAQAGDGGEATLMVDADSRGSRP